MSFGKLDQIEEILSKSCQLSKYELSEHIDNI